MKQRPHRGANPTGDAPCRPEDGPAPRPPEAARPKTLRTGLLWAAAAFALAFASAFLYQYWKPKHGTLVIRTTPPGARITIDGVPRGETPLALPEMPCGTHSLRAERDGYAELSRDVTVRPSTTRNLHWDLAPVRSQLSAAQKAEIDAWRRKLEAAREEAILLPPPEQYNVLYCADRILGIDPANAYARDVRTGLAVEFRRRAESAYARQEWAEARTQYENLSLVLHYDAETEDRLEDIRARIEEDARDLERQVAEWKERAEAAIEAGRLLPPETPNAFDAAEAVGRLDPAGTAAAETKGRILELLQSRGDAGIAAGDPGIAREVFLRILEYFPGDLYSRARLASAEEAIARLEAEAQTGAGAGNAAPSPQQQLPGIRQSALGLFHGGSYGASIEQWNRVLEIDPGSDEAHFYLGACLQAGRRLDDAMAHYERCLRLNPGNAAAHLNLGLLYDYHRREYAAAAGHLKKALELGGSGSYDPGRLAAMVEDLQYKARAMTVPGARLPAEHAHLFSGCRGELRFTEEGVEYTTAETGHGFYETYGALGVLILEGSSLKLETRSKTYRLRLLNEADALRVRAWGELTGTIEVRGAGR